MDNFNLSLDLHGASEEGSEGAGVSNVGTITRARSPPISLSAHENVVCNSNRRTCVWVAHLSILAAWRFFKILNHVYDQKTGSRLSYPAQHIGHNQRLVTTRFLRRLTAVVLLPCLSCRTTRSKSRLTPEVAHQACYQHDGNNIVQIGQLTI